MPELRKCSRCRSTILSTYFTKNRKGELFKTCDKCRGKRKDIYYEEKLKAKLEFKRMLEIISKRSEDVREIYDPDNWDEPLAVFSLKH